MMSTRGPVSPSADSSREPGAPGSATDPGPASASHDSHVADPAAEKPEPTFTSSLSIAVDGNLSLGRSGKEVVDPEASTTLSQPPTETPTTRRAPRKSKIDALAALNRSRSPSVDVLNSQSANQGFGPASINGIPVSVSATLDMSTVKTLGPRNIRPRTKPRLFDLEDCPTFHPSPEEFKDPMSYIRSISSRGQEYGIIKIVPPIGWKMPFVTDTEVI